MTTTETYTKAKLIGCTQPVGDTSSTLSDIKELIAYCARVSNPSNQNNTATTDKLLQYLLKHKHFSPFELASATIEIETTRDIARQLLRHRSFSFQEFSQRYADPTTDLAFVIREARMQDTKNRQNSLTTDDQELKEWWESNQQQHIQNTQWLYSEAVRRGIAKEQARCILPEGNTMSRLYVNGTIRSYIHYLEVRMDVSTQLEHRVLALEVARAINAVFNTGYV